MILSIRKRIRFIVVFLIFVLLQSYSTEVYALTSGPAQEEYASFEPIGTTDMVDLYSGDFTYNIPLLSVPGPNGGYPINLAYHSGIGMEQEASWVGLGWNVNVGAVNRNLRGLPDDFNGDEVTHEQHMRKSWTVGLGLFHTSGEILGINNTSSNSTIEVYYNNYKGLGYRVKYSPTYSAGPVDIGVSMSYDPHEGLGLGASLEVSGSFAKGASASLGVSGAWNSRQGLQGITISGSISGRVEKAFTDRSGNYVGTYGGGGRLYGGVTFNFNQGVPAVTMPMQNTDFSTEIKLGFSADNFPGPGSFSTNFPLSWTGRYSESKIKGDGIITSKAYGYMNMENATDNDLRDFSFTPIDYNQKLPHISPSNVTNDVFGITGQGIGGAFRGYRTDIGIFSQKNTVSTTEQYRASLDLGFTPTPTNALSCAVSYHLGIGGIPPSIGTSIHKTGAWKSGLGTVSNLKNFKSPANYQHLYDKEVKFYKDIGDRPAIFGTNSMYDVWKQEEPIRLEIDNGSTPSISVQDVSGGVDESAGNFAERTHRTARSRVIQSLTRNQTVRYGLTKDYKYYDSNDDLQSKFTDYHKTDHVSEISILEPDGMRYIYGLPAYNITQEDATFSVAKNTADLVIPNPTTNTPSAPGYDQAFGDWSKKPEFLDKKTLPAYAHSWMLTSVVSADYVDVTGNGISEDDLGYWVDFKYAKTTDSYNWRAPYNDAIYMPGTNQHFDDKASYSKGTKELFYLKEIRTKTHVAIYETENRDDALGASTSDNGGKPSPVLATDKMQKLKSIKLYTIDEYNRKTASYTPEPLKVAHFEYMLESDALCKGVPNHAVTNGGKLTLKKVYFTYGKLTKGSLSPYEFEYSSDNPVYSLKNHDCWGNYQDNSLNNYPYHEFPYTDQSIDPNIPYNAPWHLTSIKLPTGGALNIEYERDDYAYVEDKKAMQLYDIAFTGKGGDFAALGTNDFSERGTNVAGAHVSSLRNKDHHNVSTNPLNSNFEYRIYFPLKKPIPDASNPLANDFYKGNVTNLGITAWFKKNYIGDTEELYFKSAVKLLKNDAGAAIKRDNEKVDFVGGYAELRKNAPLSHYGVSKSPNAAADEYDIGYITVKPIEINVFGAGKDRIHPIRDAAFQHLRFARPELVNGTKSASGIASLFSFIPDLLTSMMGYKYAYKIQDWCAEIFLDGFSQIRLLVPDGKKIGGGIRVKKLSITDNWNEMTGGGSSTYQDGEYGQVYDYTIEENDEVISSGVAYEPFSGKEQNPLVTPIRYEHSSPMQNPNNLFLENPIMMRHYPGASVGYRKVTVKSLSSEDETNKRSRTPFTEYEFYSPKEFPVKVNKTVPDKSGPHYKIIPIPGIYVEFRRYEAMSQGYTIVFNDMAGKMKSVKQKTYPDLLNNYPGEVISKQEYEYFTNTDGSLLNEVDVFVSDGVYEKAKLGIDYDVQVEMNENTQSSDNFTLDLNFDSGIIIIPTGPACIPFPMVASGGVSTTSSSLKTAVVQKFVSKSGILKSTTITNQNSTIKTENLVFDKITGKPLLTKTTNEFNDDIYAYNQQAYWEYEGMAEAFKNTGAVLSGPYTYTATGINEGTYKVANVASLSEFPLIEGDEVYLEYIDISIPLGVKATVYSIAYNGGDRHVGFAKQDGTLVDAGTIDKITITRSGRRNLLNAPAGAIAAMDFDYQPNANIGDSRNLTINETSKVLNASAVKYRDYWPTAKNCEVVDVCNIDYCTPAMSGVNTSNLANKMNLTGEVVMKLDDNVLPSDDIEILYSCTDITKLPQLICPNTREPWQNLIVEVNGVVVNHTSNATCSYGGTDGYIDLPCQPEQKKDYLDNVGDYRHEITINNGTNTSIANFNDVTAVAIGGNCTWSRIEFILDGRVTPQLDEGPIGEMVEFWDSPIGNQVGSTSQIDYSRYAYKMSIDWPNRAKYLLPWYDHYQLSGVTTMPLGNGFTTQIRNLTANVVDPQMANTLRSIGDHPYIDWKVDRKLNFSFAEATPKLYYYTQNTSDFIGAGGLKFRLARVYDNQNIWGWTIQNTNTYNAYIESSEQFESLRVNGLTVGQTYTIKYLRGDGSEVQSVTGVAQGTPTQIDQIQVRLPVNQTSTVKIFEPGNPNPVNIETITTGPPPPNGVRVNIPMIGEGTHKLEVFHNGVSQEITYHTCDETNKVEEIPLCDNGGNIGEIEKGPNYNLYNQGTKGRWRPWTSYTYVSKRYYGDATNPNPSIREKGVFEDFTPFSWSDINIEKWQWAAMSTKYNADGYEVENVDALGNHSTALYDYNENLATAVAKNARYNEVMFDGFENYPKGCTSHTYLTDDQDINDNQDVTSLQSHTGEYSYKVEAGSTKVFEPIKLGGVNEAICAEKLEELDPVKYSEQDILDFLQNGVETPNMKIPKVMRTTTTSTDGSFTEVLPIECSCLGRFAPEVDKKYHLSAWVKRDLSVHNIITYNGLYISINFKDAAGTNVGNTVTLSPEGSMVEKWQRVTGDFAIPTGAVTMEFSLVNIGSDAAFLDDLRMLPFEASMATYVYDKITLRNTATLDDNNFATFYIYDAEGKLIKTKKETPEGIKTINEGRQHVRGPIN